MFPAHLFIISDLSHKPMCIDTLNPPVLRLFKCDSGFFVVGPDFGVTKLDHLDIWEYIKTVFNNYIHLYPYRVGSLNIQLVRNKKSYILRIGDSYIQIPVLQHLAEIHGHTSVGSGYVHLASDMPPISVAVDDWLLALGLVNGVGTLFLSRQGRCERIRLSGCVVSQSSRLLLVGKRLFTLTGTKRDILGELYSTPSRLSAPSLADSMYLHEYLEHVEIAKDVAPTLFPLWTRDGAVTGVAAAAEFTQDALCLLKETGEIVVLDLSTMESVYVGNIGEPERASAILMIREPDIYIQFTQKRTKERTVLRFRLTQGLLSS